MRRLRSLRHWLAGEWPVPRWLCLWILVAEIARLIGL